MDDETPVTRPPAPATEPTTPSDAELSRIAREAVRQPADPRLDRQLARMGLTDDPDDAVRRQGQAGGRGARPGATAEAVDALRGRVRRLEISVLVLVVAVVSLAALVLARSLG